jgi:hypothetical protein
VASSEPQCPFCGARIIGEPARMLPLGRLSRAAVFAGAALATSCGGTKKPADTTTTQTGSGSAQTEAPADAATVPIPDHETAKPYGAPPARKRIV